MDMSVKNLEQCLAEHPGVAAVCVLTASLSLPVTAFVTATPGSKISPSELREWARKRAGDLVSDAEYILLEEMPRTRTGAVDRAALDDMRRQARREQVA